MSVEISFQRSVHDRHHPYSMIANALIDNMDISNNLKMLLLYCIRKPPTWVFDLDYLCNCMDMSKRHLYRIIEEGINHGYITKHQHNDKGVFGKVTYYFSESPKFKKCSPCDKTRHAVNVTPSLYSNTDEFEASSQKPSYEEESMPIERDDIEALPFGCKDKRILSQYPREAIAYAKRCISKMPITPKKPVAVFTNLCKTYLNKKSQSTGRQEKSYESCGRLKKTVVSKCPLIDEFTFLCGKGQFYYEVTFEDIVVKIQNTWYRIDKSDALFEEKMKNCIRILNEKISRTT